MLGFKSPNDSPTTMSKNPDPSIHFWEGIMNSFSPLNRLPCMDLGGRWYFLTASPSMYSEPVSGKHWITRLGQRWLKWQKIFWTTWALVSYCPIKKCRKTVKGKPKSTIIHFKLLNDIALPPLRPKDLGSLTTTEIILSINRFPAKSLNETKASISGGKTY